MAFFTKNMIILDFDGELSELNACRINEDKKVIFTKDAKVNVRVGSKLAEQDQYGYKNYYLVTSISKKPSLTGTLKIHVMKI